MKIFFSGVSLHFMVVYILFILFQFLGFLPLPLSSSFPKFILCSPRSVHLLQSNRVERTHSWVTSSSLLIGAVSTQDRCLHVHPVGRQTDLPEGQGKRFHTSGICSRSTLWSSLRKFSTSITTNCIFVLPLDIWTTWPCVDLLPFLLIH